jgi:hypothetical protein
MLLLYTLASVSSGLRKDFLHLCTPDLPFMSVGDYNITKDNFEK